MGGPGSGPTATSTNPKAVYERERRAKLRAKQKVADGVVGRQVAERLTIHYDLSAHGTIDNRVQDIADKSLAWCQACLDSGDAALIMPLAKIILARTSQALVSQTVDRFEELREMMGGLVSDARRTIDVDGEVVMLPEADEDG